MKKLCISALMASLLAACSSAPLTQGGAPAPVESRGATVAQIAVGEPHGRGLPNEVLDPASPLSKRVLFFDYDSFQLRSDAQDLAQKHGRYLAANPHLQVLLQGHADERGSGEYNLALGQKRAETVRNAFKLLGVGDSQVEAVSYGKERPADQGHTEAAWEKNRRVEILYKNTANGAGEF